MSDLDQLSREVAAAGDEWMVPGAEAIDDTDGGWLRICQVEPDRLLGVWAGQLYEWTDNEGIRPNLADPVTVNALLGGGEISVWQSPNLNRWICTVPPSSAQELTRTEAICRAWIAARGKG